MHMMGYTKWEQRSLTITKPLAHVNGTYITGDRISNLCIGVSGVEKQLASLNSTKACGPDELPPRLLKTVAQELAPSLTFLFQQSYNLSISPSQWKQTLVTGIYKKGPKSQSCNYHPISLTCICSKIMEHIILSHIPKYINMNNILIDSRHGYPLLCNLSHPLMTGLPHHNIGQTDVILLDFSKAFD